MHLPTPVKIFLIVALVLFASLSTFFGARVFSESRAHADYLSARADVKHDLKRAVTIGLYPKELAGYRAEQKQLNGPKAPSSPLWSTKASDFYSRQATASHNLDSRIKGTMSRITQRSRAHAAWLLRSLHSDLKQAVALGMETQALQRLYAQQSKSFDSGSYPKQYRKITSLVTAPAKLLHSQIPGRRAFITGVLKQSGNAAAGVVQEAQNEANSVGDELSLIGLFKPQTSGAYQATLNRLVASVRSQTTAAGAATKAADVHDEVGQINADFHRIVPDKVIVVSTEGQWVHLWQSGKQVLATDATTGGPELPTDHGIFHIYMKATPWTFHSPWGPDSPYYYPPTDITYWMPFDGGEGLHDAWWRSNFGPGSNYAPTDLGTGNEILGTHGCVNLPSDAAAYIWNWAPVGTTVVVI